MFSGLKKKNVDGFDRGRGHFYRRYFPGPDSVVHPTITAVILDWG